ncbi:MAG: extracellular solute-binding protein, partial [Clostridia bacterium]|nr:extracellular solute-binding protein [Clostridia bacterium]
GVRIFCISAFSDHPEEAADFLKFLTSQEMAMERFERTGQIPARKDITIDDELTAGVMAQAAYAFPMPAINEMGQYWATMGAVYANVWDGADAATELEAAAAVMEAAFGN